MVEAEIGTKALGMATGAISVVGYVVMTILILLAVGVIAYFIYDTQQYNIKVIIKRLTNNKKKIRITKAKKYIDKYDSSEGLMVRGIKKPFNKIDLPPSEAIEVQENGKDVVTMYELPEHGLIYQVDNVNKIINKLPDGWKIDDLGDVYDKQGNRKEDTIIDYELKPLTAGHRSVLRDNIIRAEARRKPKFQDYIMPIAGVTSLIMILLIVLLFSNNLAEPMLESQKLNIESQEKFNVMLDKIDILINDKQILQSSNITKKLTEKQNGVQS